MSETIVDVEGRQLKLTNLDKVLYPATGTTKGEVLNYYAQIAEVMLPHLADRCVTRVRWPHGVAKESFFEKNAPSGTPSWVRTVEVPTTGSRGRQAGNEPTSTLRFPVIDDLATLMWVVQLAALELHVHQWRVTRAGRPRQPDRLVVDLDPGEPAGLSECAQVALAARDWLAERDLQARPVLSGSKGLHVYAALPPGFGDSDVVSAVAKQLADDLAAQLPGLVTATMTKSRRTDRVFIDWSQNAGSKTTLSPYSLRGRERPTAAAPVTWDEVRSGAEDPLALGQFTYDEVLNRVNESGDLFAP